MTKKDCKSSCSDCNNCNKQGDPPLGNKLYMLEERTLPNEEWYADSFSGSDDLDEAISQAQQWVDTEYEDDGVQEVRIVEYERRDVVKVLRQQPPGAWNAKFAGVISSSDSESKDIPFQTTAEKILDIAPIVVEMKKAGLNREFIFEASELARVDEGVYDLMRLWELASSENERSQITSDINKSLAEYSLWYGSPK